MASIWGGDNPSVAWNENSWASNTLTVSLTGLSTTSSVGNPAILAYENVDITGNTSYSDVDITGNTSYTDVTHAA